MQKVGYPNSLAVPAPHPPSRGRAVLFVVAAAVFVSNLDLFVVNVALPAMNDRFGGSTLASLSWVLNGYAIVFAALLVPAGRLADRIGHRSAFLGGLALFTAASALCALAPDVGWLVAARLLQAVGAALLMPSSLALLLDSTEPGRRPAAVRAWASIGGVAAGLGPVAGGLLVELDWRWVFLVNLPVGLAALVAGARVLPRLGGRTAEPLPDLLGAALLTAAIAVLAVGLVKSGEWGWGSARVSGALAAALALTAWFLLRSARHPAPVVELPLLRVPTFAAANATALLFTAAFAGMLLTSVLWCQDVWGYSALRTGFALAPGPLLVPPVTLASGPLVRRFGHGGLSVLGTLVFAAGIGWWAVAIGTAPAYAAELLPGMLLTGLGVGLTVPTLIGAASGALPPARFATGSAVTTMARQIGAVVGVAVVISVLGTPHGAQAALEAFRRGWLAVVAAALLSTGAAVLLALAQRRAARAAV